MPVSEDLTYSQPCPSVVADATLIAVDGSQINPDRHAARQFAVINAAAVIMRLRSGQTTELCTESELLYGEDVETNNGLMSDSLVAFKRDIKERELAFRLSHDAPGTVITLTDGPLELWRAEGEEMKEAAVFIEKYKVVLSRLHERGVIPAGYVDNPGADLVVRLLELSRMPDEVLKDRQAMRRYHPFRGVDDALLFGGSKDVQPIIHPGQRSAVFKLQSSSQELYTGALSLHFFYLNVGVSNHPCLVRVEVPEWVAQDASKLDLLHAILIEQCGIMGHKPYPYLLLRAHEAAVVKHEEKPQIEQMLNIEFSRYGEMPLESSNKQSGKDLPGRRRP